MKVLGIVGSPRKGGNTDALVSQVLAGARAHGAETEKLYLDDLVIRPCRTCFSWAEGSECVVRDDFRVVVEKLVGSAGIVLGSPMYVGTVTAQMKAFIDRVDCTLVEMVRTDSGEIRFRSKLPGRRKGVIVAICDLSPESHLRHCARVMRMCLNELGVELVGEVLARRLSDMGDAEKRPELLAQAFRAGELLAEAIQRGGEAG